MANFAAVNKAIKKAFPSLDITAVRFKGYVYFDGADGADKIESLYSHPTSTSTETMISLCIGCIERATAKQYAVEVQDAQGETRQEFATLKDALQVYTACVDGAESDPRKGYTRRVSLVGIASGDTYYKWEYTPAKKTLAAKFPIQNVSLPRFNFAGFQWPRYVAVLPQGSKAKRLARYASACGPYYHAPKPVLSPDNQGKGFYLGSDGMPSLRWDWCDDVVSSIGHTGWFADSHGDGDKIRGIVFTLPKGRGFLAGYSMGEGMASGLECEIYADKEGAAHSADGIAERLAERSCEYADELADDE